MIINSVLKISLLTLNLNNQKVTNETEIPAKYLLVSGFFPVLVTANPAKMNETNCTAPSIEAFI